MNVDKIENAITHYLIEKDIDKAELWKLGINVLELSGYIYSEVKE